MMIDLVNFLHQPIWGGIRWTIELENRINDPLFLESFGYKVYSQNDEDGILHEIFRRIGVGNKTFVEFGVDKGVECNSHALLLQGWSGLWIEGRKTACEQVQRRFAPAIRQNKLKILNDYITIDNINEILSDYADSGLDLLSIDIDGNDYYIWKAVDIVLPRVVVIEYNGKFAPEIDWVMAYNKDHIWDRSDRHGASLKALEKLGREKGYQLVGTNISGINAFFVRSDLAKDFFPLPATAENLYNPARFNLGPYAIGHPALNYVGQDIEGMEGVFEYYPDWNALATYGFWKVEIISDSKRKNVLREKEGKMFLRDFPLNMEGIRFEVSTGILPSLLPEKLLLKIYVGEEENAKEFVINGEKETLTMEISHKDLKGKIVPVVFETNQLWIPDILIRNKDKRLRGISIDEISYFYKKSIL